MWAELRNIRCEWHIREGNATAANAYYFKYVTDDGYKQRTSSDGRNGDGGRGARGSVCKV
jgi:hypothetical protein